MKSLVLAAAAALVASQAFAQSFDGAALQRRRPQRPAEGLQNDLATRVGQEASLLMAHYNYAEPGDQPISIHGIKFGGEYTETLAVNRRQHWFAQINLRGTVGSVTYDGACAPYLLEPNSTSPNGYELDLGDFSPCSESGDRDWYVEGRALFGKDLIGRVSSVSPYVGLGLRHLSNGTTGLAGYRTDDYLSVPIGMTARMRMASRRVLSVNLEYDFMIHGWQHTAQSQLGGGEVPATPTAPEFSIDGFSDLSFSQPGGWALRASAKYELTRHAFVEPYYLYWNVRPSATSNETVGFTANGISAQEVFGAVEPLNHTREFGVKLGFHFR